MHIPRQQEAPAPPNDPRVRRTIAACSGIGGPAPVTPWHWPARAVALACALVERFEQAAAGPARLCIAVLLDRAPRHGLPDTLTSLARQTVAPAEIRLLALPGTLPSIPRRAHRACRRPRPRMMPAADWPTALADTDDRILLLRSGDRLPPRAVAAFEQAAAQHPEADLWYGDEDDVDPHTGARLHPRLKPGWAPVTLLSQAVCGASLCVRRDVLLALQPPEIPRGDDALDRIALALARHGGAGVRIPAIMVHCRPRNGANPRITSAPAVRAHLQACNLDNPQVTADAHGTRRLSWAARPLPPVSVVMLQRAPAETAARRHIARLLAETDYPPLDITCVTLAADTGPPLADPRVRCIAAADPRCMADTLNAAAATVRGAQILFLDPGLMPDHADWLRELVRWMDLPGVEVVGPVIVCGKGRIRHAGLAYGVGPLVGPYGLDRERHAAGEFLDPAATRNVAAVSLRALLVRRSVFENRGGFDARLGDEHLDVDFCARVRSRGGQVVCHPGACLRQSTYAAEPTHASHMLMAQRIRAHPPECDPFLHPRIDVDDSALPVSAPGTLPAGMRIIQKAHAVLAARADAEPLDIFDPATLAAFAETHGLDLAPPRGTPADAARDPDGAARWMLQQLYEQPALRRRFPHALGDGAEGAWCAWCCTEGAAAAGLDAAATRHLRAAFAQAFGYRIRHAMHWRWDLRFYFPLAALPWGRRAFLRWAATDGQTLGLTATDLWWFLLESHEDPARELATLYGLLPEWQRRHPQGLTPEGWPRLRDWVRDVYALPRDAPAALNAPRDPVRPPCLRSPSAPDRGVNLMGHLCLHSGNKQSVETCMAALHRAGLETAVRDVPALPGGDPPDRRAWLDTERYDVSVNFLSLTFSMEGWYSKAGLAPRPDTYHIGNWFLEFREVLPEWIDHAAYYDEAWAATRFIASIMRDTLPIPVTYLPVGHIAEPPNLPRRTFGLPEDRFCFLFVFDMGSSTDRKNPYALIEAFRRAVRPDDRATLVLKFSQGDRFPDTAAALQRAAEGAGDVRLIDATYARRDVLGLIQCCDCYVSLHRCEGLGLTIAEAMMMGQPAIATAYSGNLDFMTPHNSLLVDYELIGLPHDSPPFRKGWQCADASVDHAAAHLRWVLDHPAERAALAERGRRDACRYFDMQAYSARLADRLRAIRHRA